MSFFYYRSIGVFQRDQGPVHAVFKKIMSVSDLDELMGIQRFR